MTRLRRGDRVCYVEVRQVLGQGDEPDSEVRTVHPEDLGVVAEVVYGTGARVVLWDTGEIDDVEADGSPRSMDTLAVQTTGERWGRRRVAAALELALDEEVTP